jgi:glyoxylate reductase
MPSKKLSVVVTRRLPQAVETRMTELFDVKLRADDAPMTREALVAAMQDADVLVPTITDQIDARLLAQAGERLKLIANYGAGIDNVDVSTARQRGILVTNTPGVLTDDTADMTLALMLSVLRRIPEGMRVAQSDDWAGCDLLGKPGPDGCPHGRHQHQLPTYPVHIPPDERPAAETDEA